MSKNKRMTKIDTFKSYKKSICLILREILGLKEFKMLSNVVLYNDGTWTPLREKVETK